MTSQWPSNQASFLACLSTSCRRRILDLRTSSLSLASSCPAALVLPCGDCRGDCRVRRVLSTPPKSRGCSASLLSLAALPVRSSESVGAAAVAGTRPVTTMIE